MPLSSAPEDVQILQRPLALHRLGLIEYNQALEIQRRIHREVTCAQSPNTLLLLEHPSVYTAGKRTSLAERPTDGTPVIDVDRGGKITWHGVGQLVGYPIVKLAKPTELVAFVREIEAGIINVCAEFGIRSQRIDGRSGVWVCDEKGDRKIAAIGIRIATGVSMHGFALNINPDLSAFTRIIPCGISDAAVTSMAVELGNQIQVEEVSPIVEKYIFESLMKVSA